jgi:hypothetical protein
VPGATYCSFHSSTPAMPLKRTSEASRSVDASLIASATVLQTLSREIAEIIKRGSHNAPVVYFVTTDEGLTIFWTNVKIIISILVKPGSQLSIRRERVGELRMEAPSLEDGVALIRHTETILQKTDWPYIRLD